MSWLSYFQVFFCLVKFRFWAFVGVKETHLYASAVKYKTNKPVHTSNETMGWKSNISSAIRQKVFVGFPRPPAGDLVALSSSDPEKPELEEPLQKDEAQGNCTPETYTCNGSASRKTCKHQSLRERLEREKELLRRQEEMPDQEEEAQNLGSEGRDTQGGWGDRGADLTLPVRGKQVQRFIT